MEISGQQHFFPFSFSQFLFIYLYLAVLGLHGFAQAFSNCSECGLLFVARHRLLNVMASLLWSTGCRCTGQQLQHERSVVAACRLSCSAACGSSQTRDGLNPCPLHWQVDSYPLLYQGNLRSAFLSSAEKMDHSTFNRPTVRIKRKMNVYFTLKW